MPVCVRVCVCAGMSHVLQLACVLHDTLIKAWILTSPCVCV